MCTHNHQDLALAIVENWPGWQKPLMCQVQPVESAPPDRIKKSPAPRATGTLSVSGPEPKDYRTFPKL